MHAVIAISTTLRPRFKTYESIITHFEFPYKLNHLFLTCNDLGLPGRLLLGEFQDFNHNPAGLLALPSWIPLGFWSPLPMTGLLHLPPLTKDIPRLDKLLLFPSDSETVISPLFCPFNFQFKFSLEFLFLDLFCHFEICVCNFPLNSGLEETWPFLVNGLDLVVILLLLFWFLSVPSILSPSEGSDIMALLSFNSLSHSFEFSIVNVTFPIIPLLIYSPFKGSLIIIRHFLIQSQNWTTVHRGSQN